MGGEESDMSGMADYTIYHRVVELASHVNPSDGKIFRCRSSINVRCNIIGHRIIIRTINLNKGHVWNIETDYLETYYVYISMGQI